MATSDRIEKQLQLRAPVSRVWRAISDAAQFGEWFRVRFEGQFAAGQTLRGRITHPGYEHVMMEVKVDRIEPETLFSYRWHPYAVDPKTDFSQEEPTLVEFRLEPRDGGTLLTITESGFDRLPAHRRDEAFRMNEGGWGEQLTNIERHVAASR
jgi:uncharacterized protein YndB with AHSA1/START domain